MAASFRSTLTPPVPRLLRSSEKLLVDPLTGAPVGIQNENANGFDGLWSPVVLTAAQIANPTVGMLADINATYQLNTSPFTRYYSNGSSLVSLSPAVDVIVPPGFNELLYAPLMVSAPTILIVQGSITVITKPA